MQIRISESQIKLADVVEQLSGEDNLETLSGAATFLNALANPVSQCYLTHKEIWKNKRTMPHKKTAKQSECGNPPLMATPVAAGFPSPAEQYIESPLDLNELLVHRPAATFFVRAAGDSMTGAGIRPGDILVVDRSLEARDGSIVIACVDNEFTVKFLRSDGERWYLQPANRKYKPITFSEGMELRIFGVVTAVIHQFVKLSNGKGK